jgi:hypothetical protein
MGSADDGSCRGLMAAATCTGDVGFTSMSALVVWRDWINQAADDPRHKLAFHAQLSDYSRELRQEGGGVTRAWIPGAPPDGWTY